MEKELSESQGCVKGGSLSRGLTYVVPVLGACLIFVLSGSSSSSTLEENY